MIIALGSSYNHPFASSVYDQKDQINSLQETYNKAKNVKKILVIGGGAVGVEVAGEFATDCKDKTVTLITSADRLMPRMSDSFSKAAANILNSKNVQVILNDRIDVQNIENFKTHKLKTQNGRDVEFDAFFMCIGAKPCTDIVKKSFPEWVDSNGLIRINEYLNVITGDCFVLIATSY